MSIKTQLSASLKDAMRNREQLRLATLRLMLAAIKDREIALKGEDGKTELSETDAIALFARMIKQREESVATYEQAGRMELAEQERDEIAVIREFLPKPLSQAEVEAAVKDAIAETGAETIRDMGRVMGALKTRHAGRMDFAAVGGMVRAALA